MLLPETRNEGLNKGISPGRWGKHTAASYSSKNRTTVAGSFAWDAVVPQPVLLHD